MNSNLKQPQKTINNSQPATFIPHNETIPLSSVPQLEQSLINVSAMDGAMEKLPNQNSGILQPILQNCEPLLGLGKQDLGGRVTTMMQEKKTQSIKMRDQNMRRDIEERVKIVREGQKLYENNDKRVCDIDVIGKQMEYLHKIGRYNNVVNNKYGKQKIDDQYVKGNNGNKQVMEVTNINLVQNMKTLSERVEKRNRVSRLETLGFNVNKRVKEESVSLCRNQIEQETYLGLQLKNKGKQNMNLSQEYSSVIDNRQQRAPYSGSSSPMMNTSGLYQVSSHQSGLGSQLIHYNNTPTTPINHRNSNSGLLWNNNSIGLNSGNGGLRNSSSGNNLGMMMGSSNIQSGGSVNSNVKNFVYESNSNNHPVGCLLGGLFDSGHMMIDNQNMIGSMGNLNSNSLLRRFSTHTNTPVSTLLSSTNKHLPVSQSTSNYHQPIYHKQPKLVINSINSNLMSKQIPINSGNKYVNSNGNNNNNNDTFTNNVQNISSNMGNVNSKVAENNTTLNIIQTKDTIQQARAMVYANKDKKNYEPEVIVLDSEQEQQKQQLSNYNNLQKENKLKQVSTNVNKTLLNQPDYSKSILIHQNHVGKSLQSQQNNQIRSSQIQQNNQIKNTQIPMSMPSANLYPSTARSFLSLNNTPQQYSNYLHNYLNKPLIYPPATNPSLLPFSNSTNPLQYESPLFMEYYNQPLAPQLPSSINNINNMTNSKSYSGKQYKSPQVSERGYQFHGSKYLEKTKQIYKQHQGDGRGGNAYNGVSNVDNRLRQLERQKAMGSFLPTQPYYNQYNQYPNIIKSQHQPTNYAIIKPNIQFPLKTSGSNISNISSSNSNIDSSKYPMPSSFTFKSSLTQQRKLDIINSIERNKVGFDGLFYNDNQFLNYPNNSQLYEQNNNRIVMATTASTSQNKSLYTTSSQQKPTKLTDSKDTTQLNAPRKRNSFYLNSLRQIAQKLEQQISNNNPQVQNHITSQQLQNNKLKLQRIKKQLQSAQHVKKQVQKAFLKTRSRITSQCPPLTKQNDISKKVNKKDKITNKDQQKSVNSQISTNVQQKEKYTFQWTPRLKKLRQLTKKRDYDSVILTGPDFQADIPDFMTDRREIRTVIGIKRASLLKRMFKYSSEIEEKHLIM